ncbi:hypothetical protein FHT70_005930 [Rhizobium sp. BK049]|nr:hypothetical protein [Rhizobium sp. BK049]
MFVCKTLALHSLVLSTGQSLLQNGLFQRGKVNILSETVENNPLAFAAFTVWNPNAFDGQDKDFIGKPLHDQTGRFVPYFFLDGAKLGSMVTPGYDDPQLAGVVGALPAGKALLFASSSTLATAHSAGR